MKHCTDEMLEKYLGKKCGLIRSVTVSAHLRKCDECKRKLEMIEEDRTLLTEIKEAVGGQAEIEKMEVEFKGLGRLRKLLDDDEDRSKTASRG